MKIIFAILLAQTLTLGVAQAQRSKASAPKKNTEQKVCERLLEQAQIECDEIMCNAYLEDGEPGVECERDGDFAEGHQICVYDDVLPGMITDYNERHQKKPVTCEDI